MRAVYLKGSQYAKSQSSSVVFKADTSRFYEYEVSGYLVWLYKDGRKPDCSCEFGSMWGNNDPFKYCKHIQTVKERVKQEGDFKW